MLDRLAAVARGDIDRLMVFMPPGSAKSTYGTVLFVPWFLARHPHHHVICAAHTATLAQDFSRRCIGLIREHTADLGLTLTSENTELWGTTNGGRYRAAGVGGPITGSRADLAVIDDPVKSRAEAESERIRDVTWCWYRSDLTTRLKPGGRIVLIMTRWHEDDLAGRLLAAERDRWHVLSLSALAEADDVLGRAPGEPLWPNYQTAEFLADARRTVGERDWASLYQQRPAPPEGALFRPAMMPTLDAAPAEGRAVRHWDLAATAVAGTSDPDWTVGLRLTVQDGRYVITDVVRLRGAPENVELAILNTAAADGRATHVSLPQDPGQAGKAQAIYLTRRLAGYGVTVTRETGDKITRAQPVASQCNVGNVFMIRAEWNRALREELALFPSGTHDDQVDALSGAFAFLAAGLAPITVRQGGWMGNF